jgi:DNA-binding FadR family transcriptional regulator
MSPSHLFEPTYQAIKQRLKSGAWNAGARLEAARIAAELGVSISPVRDSLNRLAGERMIEARAGEGFQVPRFEVQTLRRILDVNQALLTTAILRSKPVSLPFSSPDSHAERSSRIFRYIAQHSRNSELETLVDNLNDRLYRLRLLDQLAFPDGSHDLMAIEEGLSSLATARDVRQAIRHYHERRRRAADRLVRLVPSI